MRCPHCKESVSNKSRFCMYCGKAIGTSSAEAGLGNYAIIAYHTAASDATWGALINVFDEFSARGHRSRPTGCPGWVEERDWRRWRERGLVVWDNTAHTIGRISFSEATQLLANLQENEVWKTQGITIVERTVSERLIEPPRPKRARNKKIATGSPNDKPKYDKVVYEDERVRLTGSAAEEFYAFLETNEVKLREIIESQKKQFEEAMVQVYERLMGFHRATEIGELDLTSRKFNWVRQTSPTALVCDLPPDRATILLSDDNFFWRPIIEQPNWSKNEGRLFHKLEEALDWLEDELPKLRAEVAEFWRKQEQEAADDQVKLAALPKKDLTPYWIDPSVLEPKRAAYRVIIHVDYEPYSFKETEISFGQKRRYDKEFYTPTMLANQLGLKSGQVEIKQLTPYFGLYQIRSVTTYYDVQLAATHAQQLWAESGIQQRYLEKKVVSARFGVEEVGIEYCTWLGGLDDPNSPGPQPKTRADYLVALAMRATLLYALDIDGFRQFTGLRYRHLSDEQLLHGMHEDRAELIHIPPEARAESQRWLKKHAKGTKQDDHS